MLALGERIGASRIEIAHVQYYGWGLVNRTALMPSLAQLEAANAEIERARAALHGRITIDYVVPDYHAARPKACMGGWGRRMINITPAGLALPCHAAQTLPGFRFASVRTRRPCRDLARRSGVRPLPRHALDAGAVPRLRSARDRLGRLPLPGLRTDSAMPRRPTRPASLSPDHHVMAEAVAQAASAQPDFIYRRIGAAAEVA